MMDIQSLLEVNARQAAEIYDLKDKLAEANEMKTNFFDQWQESLKSSIPVIHIPDNEVIGALAHAEQPHCSMK